eukprot:5378714-Karenia_brevis.AAC.1
MEGRWALGDRRGFCQGVILWSGGDCHACALEGDNLLDLLEEVPDRTGSRLEPWEIYPVGAK